MRTLLLAVLLAVLACDGPMGPPGPEGPQGPTGPQGPPGPQGPGYLPPSYQIALVAEGLGPVSGHLVDATFSEARGILVAEQRGVVQQLAGPVLVTLPVPRTEFGGLFGIVEFRGVVYLSYSDAQNRLNLAKESGPIVWRSQPYAIQHFGGGLAVHNDRILLGYGNGVSFTGPGDPKDGGVLAIDPATGMADTVAVGLRNPFKLAVTGDTLAVSSAGEFRHEGIYRAVLGGPRADFGYPVWEGPVCHTLPDCPAHTPPWYTYPTAAFGCSAVVGGAWFDAAYWFADFCEGWIRSYDGRRITQHFDLPGRLTGLRLLNGRLYVTGYDGGKVWEITRH